MNSKSEQWHLFCHNRGTGSTGGREVQTTRFNGWRKLALIMAILYSSGVELCQNVKEINQKTEARRHLVLYIHA